MRNNKNKILLLLLAAVIGSVFVLMRFRRPAQEEEMVKEIKPTFGAIQNLISTTGTVLPKNRLEVKPPVNGRVEEVLVKEGDKVKAGQTLAWMSSTERAALLDAARGEGEKALEHWQEIYKAIPLVSPIDGEVIVSKAQPGTTVTASDAVVVLSDQLIVRAQVDETDIGKITKDSRATVSLDAYPDTKISAPVEHIYYESKTVNNVTVYEVDLKLEEVPLFFRSGMNATVDFIEQGKAGMLIIPVEAVQKEKQESFVLLKSVNGSEPVRASVQLGLSDDKNVEVLSGVTQNDTILLRSKKYVLPKDTSGTNPFMPSRRR